ncbi:protein FAR1-RELATED SEQUENCE 5-like [Hibiscus syriacus]|uniref:Ubiquitin thioesterase OTU n=1 Tax=Hibiscus syriacus TaxID=106335 RepID=A0A6A3CAL9_HIBSY|nr:protein FAR1-RELATED SEQUENCE 5-like [Hibiscus syriacus]
MRTSLYVTPLVSKELAERKKPTKKRKTLAVLEKIWNLQDKLSNAIHSISRAHFLNFIKALIKSDKKKLFNDVDDDKQNGSMFIIICKMEGIVVKRVISSDNSCLFNAVGYVMDHDKTKAPELRQVMAATVSSDPTKYSKAFLGKPNTEYIVHGFLIRTSGEAPLSF